MYHVRYMTVIIRGIIENKVMRSIICRRIVLCSVRMLRGPPGILVVPLEQVNIVCIP